MIELSDNGLHLRFPEVHADAECRISFQRTLRIPDDDRAYMLPPGLGGFPLRHVDDFAGRVPSDWSRHGGVFMPMYQAEALWILFRGDYPMAVKVAAGKIDAVTGETFSNDLSAEPQNYMVIPGQPWLDGFCVGKGVIRQFVAMPLGVGYTAEEQLTGAAEHGGLQVIVHPMRLEAYERILEERKRRQQEWATRIERVEMHSICASESVPEMGLAPGGRMRQKIYDDLHGIDAWDPKTRSRCFVHILNSLQYFAVTGAEPPTVPPTAKDYTAAGLPWFDYYDAERTALEGARRLAGLDSVAARDRKLRRDHLPDNEPVSPQRVVRLSADGRTVVREGEF